MQNYVNIVVIVIRTLNNTYFYTGIDSHRQEACKYHVPPTGRENDWENGERREDRSRSRGQHLPHGFRLSWETWKGTGGCGRQIGK